MDLVLRNYEFQYVYELEPFFSRVWLSSEMHKDVLVSQYAQLDNVANALFDIPDAMWAEYKHLYRTEGFDKVFCVGEPTEYQIKVVIDFSKITTPNKFLLNLVNVYEVLKDCEPGQYELDGIDIFVNSVEVINTPIVVENPQFNSSLLEVYE